MTRPFLSLCTIFRDAELFLPEFLECVRSVVDELILVDTGSVDNSLHILKASGLSYFSFAWVNDFSQAKNFAISKASGEWLLLLDVDERLRPSDARRLRTILQKEKDTEAIYLPCINLKSGDWQGEYGVRNVQYIIRIVRNAGFSYRYAIHEQIEDSIKEKGKGLFRKLECPVFHLGLLDSFFMNKIERNRLIIQEKYHAEPQNPYYMYHYAEAAWSEDRFVFELLKKAFFGSEGDLHYQIGLRILEWLREFLSSDYHYLSERDFFEAEILQQCPHSAVVHLRLAREAFAAQSIVAAIQAYEIVRQSVFSELILVEEQKEVFDRLGVLYAMQGNFTVALDCFLSLRRVFGHSCVVYHQLLKTAFVSQDSAKLEEFATDIPADMANLERPKLIEVLTILSRANFSGSHELAHKIAAQAGVSLSL